MKLDIQKFATGAVEMKIDKEYTYEQEKISTVKVTVTPISTGEDFQNNFTCSIDDDGWTSTGEKGAYYKIFTENVDMTVTFTYTGSAVFVGEVNLSINEIYNFYDLTICIDKQPMQKPSAEIKKYIIKLLEPLRSYLDVCDNFTLDSEGNYKVIRNIEKKLGSLKKLSTPIEEQIGKLKIELFEGDNYIYLQDNHTYLMKMQYLTNSKMNKTYATKMELNSKLEQTVEGFTLTVSKKVDNDKMISTINQSAEQVKINADKISLEGKTIDLTSDEIIIKSKNFEVDKNGKIKSTSGVIGGFNIGTTQLTSNLSMNHTYTSADVDKVYQTIMGNYAPSSAEKEYLDINGDGSISSIDYAIIRNIVNNGQNANGNFLINTTTSNKSFKLYRNDGTIGVSLSIFGGYLRQLGSDSIRTRVLTVDESFTNNSDERLKKDVEELNDKYINLLTEIKPVSFKYKKSGVERIGFIAQDVIKAFENNDLSKIPVEQDELGFYSLNYLDFIGILWKVTQNLLNQVIQLKERVNKLEGEVNE